MNSPRKFVLLTSIYAGFFSPVASAAAEKIFVRADAPGKIVIALGKVDLTLPKGFKSALLQRSPSQLNHINSVPFTLIIPTPSDSGTGVNLTHSYEADVQGSALKCDVTTEAASLRDKADEVTDSSKRTYNLAEGSNALVFEMDDFSHDSYNFILGAVDYKQGLCYNLSLAIYDTFELKPKIAQTALKSILSNIWSSFSTLNEGSEQ